MCTHEARRLGNLSLRTFEANDWHATGQHQSYNTAFLHVSHSHLATIGLDALLVSVYVVVPSFDVLAARAISISWLRSHQITIRVSNIYDYDFCAIVNPLPH